MVEEVDPIEEFEEKHCVKVIDGEVLWKGIDQDLLEGRYYKFTEEQLNTLQWAKDFIDKYEKKHKIRK